MFFVWRVQGTELLVWAVVPVIALTFFLFTLFFPSADQSRVRTGGRQAHVHREHAEPPGG